MVLHANISGPDPAENLLPRRRYLALYLPLWATDCLKRHDRDLAQSDVPLVFYAPQKGAMRLVAVDGCASQAGLAEGQSLSDARALCPGVVAREIDRDYLTLLFADFADWHTNSSPIVSVVTDWDTYGDLVLDISGVAHLFGGERAMAQQLVARLKTFGFSVQGAIGPSIGAVMALSHFAPGQIVSEGADLAKLEDILAALPVAALRIDDAQIEGLRQMGLKQIGQLYGRDRAALSARFGQTLLTRLDQALNGREERLVPRLPIPDYLVERKFVEPIALLDDVVLTVRDLAPLLSDQLQKAGLGAQTFHLLLYRSDHKLMNLAVNAARATRDAAHIGRLFANRMERLVGEFDAGFGIEMIRLTASSVTPLEDEQVGAFGSGDGAADLDQLYDRMVSKLGPQAVLRSKPINSHMPERAVVLEPVIARTPDVDEALVDFYEGDVVATGAVKVDLLAANEGQSVPADRFATLVRPQRLLPKPDPIIVVAEVPDGPPVRMEWRRVSYRLVKASGPERIGVEWWQPGEGSLTRDYYVVEDENGRRFWLFREGLYVTETAAPRWYLHGFFA